MPSGMDWCPHKPRTAITQARLQGIVPCIFLGDRWQRTCSKPSAVPAYDLFGVPTLYASMLALPDAAQRFDTSSLRVVFWRVRLCRLISCDAGKTGSM